MSKKKRLFGLILWAMFIIMVAIVMYISFENGEESKAAGEKFLSTFAGIKNSDAAGQKRMDSLMFLLRQSGRAIAFFMIGMVGTAAIQITCAKWLWLLRTGLNVFILWAIACFTEKMKLYIPTRHYSHEEMMISIAAAAAGFLIASLVLFFGKTLRGLSRRLLS
ncbi:MAG: VanZ family protein [Clostridium sp.]|nr:VanZ family protein [Clostridium sp.]